MSYSDPVGYIKEMYRLGATTLILNESAGLLYDINLLGGEIHPFSKEELKGFSSLKRVIQDEQWKPQKADAASLLRVQVSDLVLILALPLDVEARWIGHQVDLFQRYGVLLERISSVDAFFENGRFKVTSIHLTDGTIKKIRDPGCV